MAHDLLQMLRRPLLLAGPGSLWSSAAGLGTSAGSLTCGSAAIQESEPELLPPRISAVAERYASVVRRYMSSMTMAWSGV